MEKKWGPGLTQEEPFATHLQRAKEGKIDGYHSGFPSGAFSTRASADAEGTLRQVGQ